MIGRAAGRLGRNVLLAMVIGVGSASAQTVARDSANRIVGIMLDRRNVGEGSFLGPITRKLHKTTQAPFIRDEYLFHIGDVYDSSRVAQTARNLRALGVFTTVVIDTVRTDSGLVVRVRTQDGWSTKIITALRTTGGSAAWTLGLVETNLLGTITTADIRFYHDPDRDNLILGLHRDRVIAGKIGATLQYVPRSDGALAGGALVLPWYSNAQRFGMTVTTTDDRERIYRYFGGDPVPQDTLEERYVLGRVDIARAIVARDDHYIRVGAVVQLRRDDFASETTLAVVGIPTHTVTGALGVYVEDNLRDHHVVVHNFQAFGRPEDVDLSTVVRVTAFAAPTAFGYAPADAGIGPGIGIHTGFIFPGGFAYQDFVANGLYGSAGLDSGQVIASTTIALIPMARHQLILHAEAGALRQPLPGSEFDLGLGSGPRAYAQHAFTGDREFNLSADYRFALVPNLFHVVGVGLAAFGDYGGAWYAGSGRRTGWDAGVGLRLGVSQDPDPTVNRFDLAWRGARPGLPGGWVFAVARGFPFALGARGAPR